MNDDGSSSSRFHKPTIASSQLSIGTYDFKDKLELTCVATIPAYVDHQHEEYADYKTYSYIGKCTLLVWVRGISLNQHVKQLQVDNSVLLAAR